MRRQPIARHRQQTEPSGHLEKLVIDATTQFGFYLNKLNISALANQQSPPSVCDSVLSDLPLQM
jgi:hypothetical protein